MNFIRCKFYIVKFSTFKKKKEEERTLRAFYSFVCTTTKYNNNSVIGSYTQLLYGFIKYIVVKCESRQLSTYFLPFYTSWISSDIFFSFFFHSVELDSGSWFYSFHCDMMVFWALTLKCTRALCWIYMLGAW